jgi:hypothetical protein
MSQNIKNNLFRFVTLRNPQLIAEKDKPLGFIYHPDELVKPAEQQSKFYKETNGLEGDARNAALNAVNDSFNGFSKKSEVKDFNEKLYRFSSWLMRNKNALSYTEIKENINGAQALSSGDEIQIWDNLIHQTIVRSSVYVREALIQVLVANKFLLHFSKFSEELIEDIVFSEDQEKEFIRCAHASVVISKQLLLQAKNKPRATKSNKKQLKRLTELMEAKYDIVVLQKLEKELKEAQKSYKTQERSDYKKALETHQAKVDEILAKGTNKLVDKWDIEKQAYIKVESFEHDPLPEFNYVKAQEIDVKQLEAQLTSLPLQYLTVNKLDALTTFDAIFKQIKILINQNNNKVSELKPKASKNVVKRGVPMIVSDPFNDILSNYEELDTQIENLVEDEVSSSELSDFFNVEIQPDEIQEDVCYALRLSATATSKDADDDRNWFFKLGFTYYDEPVTISSINCSLTFTNDDIVYNNSSFSAVALGNSYKVRLFDDLDRIEMEANAGLPVLSGTVTLSNGKQLSFSETISMTPFGRGWLLGNALLSFSCNDETEEETPVVSNHTIYGVTNLGIADFRRVEQEVCCYVPGEVSHIENVMAREYKERATRSLVSSEITSETTEERERENLTDTTTTERNEMQSEVASVLNEDESQAYGGSAYVNGKYGDINFGANAYFDTSSASSTSNSNSQAQTYAQEVTERAMERIVQKTQTKRTSRILKEFEENNKHGFDNTKGSNHVTGVYRWVDKIYKNKLINYGKRLMYEFAIPEPSKFFQEAVWRDIDNNGQTDDGVILPEPPVHPRELGLLSASNLDNETDLALQTINYQKIASEYNADVNFKPLKEIIVGASDSNITAAADGPINFNGEVDIPVGYEAVATKFNFSIQEYADSDDRTFGNIKVGDIVKFSKGHFARVHLHNDTDYPNTGSYWIDASSYKNFKKPYVNKVPFSASASNVSSGNVNVSIKCILTSEGREQWQNETYNAIMDAYYDRVREYNEAMTQANIIPVDKEKMKFNPLENKSIMLRELKRVAIELMIDQNKVSKNNYNAMDEDTGVSTVKKNETFQTHASTVKFFEQAFDWDIMAYVFYPYFYANKASWKTLFQSQDAADPLFQAFLQSGMARTVVPVRPGFEDAINWYMATGEIWNGQGLVVDQDDDLYVSVAEEMQTVEGEVEGTWETRLPTALTILQAGSIGLKVEGLPCNPDCDHKLFESDNNPIAQTDTLIGGEEADDVRHIENIDIVNGNLQLNTDDEPRETVAQISIQSLKNAIDSIA